METVVKLPFPPTVNTYWRRNGGRYFISKHGMNFREQVGWLYRGKPTYTGRLAVEIEVYPPDNRRRDLDNLPKGILDSLQKAGAYEDDSQIDELIIRRRGKGDFVLVTLKNVKSS